MKNSKQVNLSMSVIETLDRIREQLPKRGSLKASYGDAIRWQEKRIYELLDFEAKYNEWKQTGRILWREKKLRK